jgi:hypothetical protein
MVNTMKAKLSAFVLIIPVAVGLIATTSIGIGRFCSSGATVYLAQAAPTPTPDPTPDPTGGGGVPLKS